MANESRRTESYGTAQDDGTDTMNEMRGRAEAYGQEAQTRAEEYGDQARDKAREIGETAQEQLDARKDQAAGGMERVAEMVRERTPDDGMAAKAGAKAADGMETAAGYLRDHDTSEMWNDLESYARQHPTQALAGAIFAGFVLGRILR